MSPKLARQLADLGASPEVIAVAIEAVTIASRDASCAVTLPSRLDPVLSPSPGAIRARRYRKNLKEKQRGAKANDVAHPGAQQRDAERDASRDEGGSAPINLLTFSQQSRSSEKEVKKEKKKEGVVIARERGSRILAGAILTDEYEQAAIKLGADPARIPDMWAEFVDYWTGIPGSRGLKCNWLGTWRNRVRDVLSRGYKNGRYTGPQADKSSSAAAGRLLDKIRSFDTPIGEN